MQRTTTNRDAQPSRQIPDADFPLSATPKQSPTTVPDVREQPQIRDNRPRQSAKDVSGRARRRHVPQP